MTNKGLAGAGVLVGAMVTALVVSVPDSPPPAPPPPSPPPPVPAAAPIPADLLEPPPDTTLHRSVPVRLDVPAIGVHTRLMRLALKSDRSVEVPPLGADSPAGWYEESVTPGEVGASVLLGHVDSARYGPAVFYRLRDLRPGDAIAVRRADGGTIRFRVTAVRLYPKRVFPARQVYGPIDHAGLRLVTCGGSFDRDRRSYRSNVVVYARPTGVSGERK